RNAGPRLPAGQRQHGRGVRARRLRVVALARGGPPARPGRPVAPPALLRRPAARARRAALPHRPPLGRPRGRRRPARLSPRPTRQDPQFPEEHPDDHPPVRRDPVRLLRGPEGQEDVIPFLRNVTAGRGVPDERLEEVAGHYRALGGRSPINAQNRELIAALQEELASRDVHLPIYFGNRNWAPYTAEALQALHADGHPRTLALITSAYSSYSGCRQYREDFARRLHETGLLGELAIEKSRSYFNQPGFLAPVVDGVAAALRELDREGHDADRVRVLFSTHSIPLAMNDASGPTGEGNWYV